MFDFELPLEQIMVTGTENFQENSDQLNQAIFSDEQDTQENEVRKYLEKPQTHMTNRNKLQ